MDKGWIVEYEDGTVITEEEKHWHDIPKTDIKRLSLKWGPKIWSMEGKKYYTQKKRATIVPGSDPQIEFRYIGYYDNGIKVWYRVEENTGRMEVVTE